MWKKVKSQTKKILLRCFPAGASSYFAARERGYAQRMLKEWGCTDFNRRLIARCGDRVLHGPFQGMVLTEEAAREHVAPILLGVYESELLTTWETILEMQFEQLIDVGAKFGYYAVGLARRFPSVPVIAFDIDPWARKATRQMAEANQVAVTTEKACTPGWLDRHLRDRAFILSDCEGYEGTLFGEARAAALSSATMLIEVHEHCSPGVGDVLRRTFADSHDLVVIPTVSPNPIAPPELEGLNAREREMAVAEFRPAEQSWMFLVPKGRVDGPAARSP
jgi:hypothetical protein